MKQAPVRGNACDKDSSGVHFRTTSIGLRRWRAFSFINRQSRADIVEAPVSDHLRNSEKWSQLELVGSRLVCSRIMYIIHLFFFPF